MRNVGCVFSGGWDMVGVKVWGRSAFLVGCVLLLAACGSSTTTGGGGTASTSTPTAAPTPAPTPTPSPTPLPAAAIGQPVSVGNLTLTVNSAMPVASDSEFITPDHAQFLLVHVTVENMGSSETTISSFDFDLRDETGQTYSVSYLSPGGTPDMPSGTVDPGDRIAGGLVYDVPTGHTFRLYFRPGYGQQVRVNLGEH